MSLTKSVGCEHCWNYIEDKTIQMNHTIFKMVGEGKRPPYLVIDMSTGGNKSAYMRVESASENRINRKCIDINYCPFCGRKLEPREEE
jgi:Pyruvate/2-oxoacid:ferredoxin oxidoreductase delta subunit